MDTRQDSLAPGPVVELSQSPHATLHPLPLDAVTLEDRFWAPRLHINRTATLPSQYRQCEDTGRIDNFRRAAGKIDKPFEGIFFNDSDVYKWLEAAAFTLATHPDDAALRRMVDEVATQIVDAQQSDGYLNTYFLFDKAAERWTDFNLHEMYCAGHFFQAAIAHYRATGATRLLDTATRYADYLCRTFGPQEGQRHGFDGHEEVEMALVELYRTTGRRRYLDQAQYFIDVRGQKPTGDPYWHFGSHYYQDHTPFRELGEVTGHAVRMVYYAAGATDLYAETGEAALKQAIDQQWQNMTTRRMYVTGGLGARYEGEAFGKDYELPSDRAYTETCAAIGSVMWNWRLLNVTGDAKYADLMELALYNGMLAGLSLDGTQYFYQNPLADDGTHRRQAWFGCACCPPNVARMLASLPGYVCSVSDDAVWIHLYAAGTAQITLPNGETIGLQQETTYPWDGEITITVTQAPRTPFALNLRHPAWADGAATVRINEGREINTDGPGRYTVISRQWQAGDQIRLTLPMPVRRLVSHPYVADAQGRVALMRGPIVYCIEQADSPDADVRDILLPSDAPLTAEFRPGLLGGVTVLRVEAQAVDRSEWENRLYRPAGEAARAATRPITLTAIPYYAWANREPGPMRVWLPRAG